MEIKKDVLSGDFTSLTTYSEIFTDRKSWRLSATEKANIKKRSLGLLEGNNKLFCIYLIYHFLISLFPFAILFMLELIKTSTYREQCAMKIQQLLHSRAEHQRGQSRWTGTYVCLLVYLVWGKSGESWKENPNKLVLLPLLIRVSG